MNRQYKRILLVILLVMHVALSSFFIPVGENLRIYFTFLIGMLTATMYEYKYIFFYAIAEDLLAFFLFPSGAFFPGYTLTTLVGMSFYWLFLYKKKVDLLHVGAAKFCTNLIANVGLNSLWSYIIYSKGFLYYAARSLPKNLILWPIETLVFLAFYQLIRPVLKKYRLVEE